MLAWPVIDVLASFGGIATTARLRAAGVTEHQVRAASRLGQLLRPRQGILALRSTPAPILAAATAGGALACISAAEYYGFWTPSAHGLHISIRANAAPMPAQPRGFVAHRDAHHLGPQERFVVLPQTCVAQCIRELPFDYSVALLDSAQHLAPTLVPALVLASRELAAPELAVLDLGELARTLPRRLHPVLSASDGRAEAGAESIARVRLLRAGLRVRVQHWVCDGIRVDLLINERLVVEIGSKEFHAIPEQYERDHQRATTILALGFELLEFTTIQVMDDWDAVEAVILSRAGR